MHKVALSQRDGESRPAMKTKIWGLASVALLALLHPAFAAEPIEGAFGQKFGERVDAGLSEIQQGPRSPYRSASFKPDNPYPGLDGFSVSVTPYGHRVFEIVARGSLSSDEAVATLLAGLDMKFGPFSPDKRVGQKNPAYARRDNGRIVHFEILPDHKVVLTFRDGALTGAARAEGVAGKAIEPASTP